MHFSHGITRIGLSLFRDFSTQIFFIVCIHSFRYIFNIYDPICNAFFLTKYFYIHKQVVKVFKLGELNYAPQINIESNQHHFKVYQREREQGQRRYAVCIVIVNAFQESISQKEEGTLKCVLNFNTIRQTWPKKTLGKPCIENIEGQFSLNSLNKLLILRILTCMTFQIFVSAHF